MSGQTRLGSARQALRRVHRGPRLMAQDNVVQGLVSVAAAAGARVITPGGEEAGRLADVVVRWGAALYPAVSGIVVRVGPRRTFIPAGQVAEIGASGVRLASTRIDLRDFARRPGEALLAEDILDHQLVDVDGARVVRASDLYLARVGEAYRLVGVDAGMGRFLRRVGPARLRRPVDPERVIDWADVAPVTARGAPVRLRIPHERLRELRPAELADVLEDLGRAERHELLTSLTPETAADVLEEMGPGEVTELLRDAPPEEAADLVARMEPDEAVDALRDLAGEDREAILTAMPADTASLLAGLLEYPEEQAGGFMTTHLAVMHPGDTVAAARRLLRDRHPHQGDIDALVVVDDDGRLLDDVGLFDLLVAEAATPIADLVGPPWPVTVGPGAGIDEVIDKLTANRRSSLVVVDGDDRPLGRILADDVLDVLASARARRWPWQPR